MKEPSPAVCSRFHKAVELIGGRWTGAIIQVLLCGPTRYAGIRASIPDISDRMLSDRLRVLESEGLVEREVVPETPVRVEYRLTEKGRSLERALGAIAAWAEEWIQPPSDDQHATASTLAHPAVSAVAPYPAAATAPSTSESRQYPAKPRIKPKIPA